MPAFHALTLSSLPDLLDTDPLKEVLPGPDAERVAALGRLRSALSFFLEAPDDTVRWAHALTARRVASAAIASMPRKDSRTPLIHEIHELVREMAKSGVHDHTVEAEDLVQAELFLRKDWPGLLAAMLLVPAWQWPAAPLLLEVPDWLRPDYVRWLFAAPQSFTVNGQAEIYAAYSLRRLEELLRWMNRGPGGTEELKVLGAYASHSSLMPACFGNDGLRRHAELRGQLLRRAMGGRDDHYQAPRQPRAGRRLRLGVIHRSFEATGEIHATLPLFEQLDPERFEVILFTYVSDFGLMEDYCRQRCADLIVLPSGLKDQLALLRNAALDAVLFGTNVTAECNVVTRLALHRVAPLQVVHQNSCITTGLPEIDLYVTGALANPQELSVQFTERLGILPGAAHASSVGVNREEAQVACVRADFGLPEDALVFVATAPFRKITPEVRHGWARVLAAVPGSYLLVHPFQSTQPSSHATNYFHAGFEDVLRQEGVDPARLVTSTVIFPSLTDVKTLVSLGDVYLDTFPFSDADALVDPLELGLPVVAWAGDTLRARTGASLLRTLELGELVASSAIEYHALAVKLATDAVYREQCGRWIQMRMERGPAFLDSQRMSKNFGAMLELGFDEWVEQGPAVFRANAKPLLLAGTGE